MPTAHLCAPTSTTIFELMRELQRSGADVAAFEDVVEGAPRGKLTGVVTQAHLAEVLAEGMELFAD